jgi:hypothetical protein
MYHLGITDVSGLCSKRRENRLTKNNNDQDIIHHRNHQLLLSSFLAFSSDRTTVDGASSARVARTTNMYASQLERHKLDAGLSPVRHVSLEVCGSASCLGLRARYALCDIDI